MRDYVRRETADRSREWQLVERNIAHVRRSEKQHALTPRMLARRYAPRRARAFVHWLRHRATDRPDAWRPSILQLWSSQFLAVVTTAMTGDVLVVVPAEDITERWTSDIPEEGFGASVTVHRQPFDRIAESARFNHVVVPLRAAVTVAPDVFLASLRQLLLPEGSAAVVLPGRAWVRPAGDRASASVAAADDVARAARARFPEMRVSVETFGNPVTARAVAADRKASEVRGVEIDHHDRLTEVLVALLIAPPMSRHGEDGR
jgi:hypothetical protein